MKNILPGFSQGENKTCEAASLVSSILIHDWLSGIYNKGFASTCKIVAAYLEKNLDIIKKIIDPQQADDYITYLNLFLKEIKITELKDLDYLVLANSLYSIFLAEGDKQEKNPPGEGIKIIMDNLGLTIIKSTRQLAPLDNILSSKELINLKSGEFAQIVWWVIDPEKRNEVLMQAKGFHAFLIVRINSRGWFLHDQAFDSSRQIRGDNLATLKKNIYKECDDGKYWLYRGLDRPSIIKFTGIRVLSF